MTKSYKQDSKEKVRKDAIKTAISLLTKNRKSSFITSKAYISELRDAFLTGDFHEKDRRSAKDIDLSYISQWEQLHDALNTKRKANELKVAYLCGPEPLNDLEIFLKEGILIENIWGFESDSKSFTKAKKEALNSKYSNLKIYQTGISNFFEASPVCFDIVYLDFCKPIIGSKDSNKCLKTLCALLKYHRLSPLGIIVTNFSCPSKEQDDKCDLRSDFTANYLYDKGFIEEYFPKDSNCVEGPQAESFDIPFENEKLKDDKNWLTEVDNHFEYYYGQLITRMVVDFSAIVIPYSSFFKKNISSKMVNLTKKAEKQLLNQMTVGKGADWLEDENRTIRRAFFSFWHDKKKYNFFDDFFRDFIQFDLLEFCKLDYLVQDKEALESSLWHNGVKEMSKEICILNEFCDVFMAHNLVEMLIGQIVAPYYVNIEKTKRWKYKAKETLMFTDLLLMDQCRYIYEWFPTLGMLEQEVHNKQRQLVYRFALDGLAKNNRYFLEDSFHGVNIIGCNKGFPGKELNSRISIE